jgi:hypothetical protein
MKVRNGFVSNSSSSSFLVAFPRNPKDAKDVQEMVFGDTKQFVHPYDTAVYTAEEIAQVIWNDAKDQIPNNRKVIASGMNNVLADNYRDFETPKENPRYPGDYSFDYEGYANANKQKVFEFMDKNDRHFFYRFDYCDDGGDRRECAMEHGDLFRNLPHLVSSNH